jgi:tRNA(Ile)-lysidine synthase
VASENVLGVVRRTLEERALLGARDDRGQTVVVACSGGADSCGLLFALTRLAPELGLTLVAASVDHGLRASAADDVAVAAAQAARLDVPFRALAVEVSRTGSLQAAARVARYDALRALAAREGAALIAVGHTRDDQAETVLARMLRGGSVRALGGIAPRRADGVIRPLLDCSRADVRALVLAERLPFVDDPSNLDPRFLRARLRADVLPGLVALDPGVVAHLADLADDARAADRALRAGAVRLLARAGSDSPDLDVLAAAAPALCRRALGRWARVLTAHAPSRAHLEALERLALTRRGEVRLASGWVARAVGGRLVAEPGHAPLQRRSGSAANGA